MRKMTSASGPKHEIHPLGYNLMAMALVVALGGLALAYGLLGLSHAQGRSQIAGGETTLKRTLVGTDLNIPVSWFRDAEGKSEGFATEVDLHLSLPLGEHGETRTINVTLVPRSQVRPSASLLDGVYLHQFLPNELAGPPGLIGKPLYGSEGFQNETVWYDALSSAPFVAKCMAPVEGATTSRCLRTVQFSTGIAAIYDFDDDVLWSWQKFDPEMKAMLSKIGLN
ncbi:MAG: hypothetical protein JWN11_1961 [Hyphomicrobiales bacterium]|nr:hypothetical protein [Hyphomicrobiales bacterium]